MFCKNRIAKVLFAYRDFRHQGKSHKGVGVSVLGAINVLKKAGINAQELPLWSKDDLIKGLQANSDTTHCIVEAVWLSSKEVQELCGMFPDIKFVIRCHSLLSFLQIEPPAVRIIKEMLVLQAIIPNLYVSGNNEKFCDSFEFMTGKRCLYLPNLYDAHTSHHGQKVKKDSDIIKLASFGALRLQKNHITGAAAAIVCARLLGKKLEFYINADRIEGGGAPVLDAIRHLCNNQENVKLMETKWMDWPDFLKLIREMDGGFQLSNSESYNIVSSDFISQGVPIVVSDSIEWLPNSWKVDKDDVQEAALKMIQLMDGWSTDWQGKRALKKYMRNALNVWLKWL